MAFGGFENFEAFEPHDVDGERDAYYEEHDLGGHQFSEDDGHWDDDPNPYAGTYDEDDCANEGEMPYENDYLYDDYCPEFDE